MQPRFCSGVSDIGDVCNTVKTLQFEVHANIKLHSLLIEKPDALQYKLACWITNATVAVQPLFHASVTARCQDCSSESCLGHVRPS